MHLICYYRTLTVPDVAIDDTRYHILTFVPHRQQHKAHDAKHYNGHRIPTAKGAVTTLGLAVNDKRCV